MVSTTVLFEPGFSLIKTVPGGFHELTGDPKPPGRVEIPGRGLIQDPHMTNTTEVTPASVRDERMVLFTNDADVTALDVKADDEFIDHLGHHWNAIADGRLRGIPRQPPEYVAVRVRRAREKETT